MIKPCLTAALCLVPVLPVAHPHIFVEARLAVEVAEDGAITGVRLSWLYDDLFSLLLTADLGIDMDGDMILPPEEFAVLEAAVLEWPADFGGDLEVSVGGAAVELSDKVDGSVLFENGKVDERHLRPLAEPIPTGETVAIRVYDPFYYVAYALAEPVEVIGRDDCTVEIERVDLDSAFAEVTELLGGRLPSEVGNDEYFPEVGDRFADTVLVTCPA